MVDEAGLARRLWIKFKDDSVFALYTPFFVGLASATLDSHTFRHFVAQDLHFLKAFAQAYELAEDCADDDDDKAGIRALRKRVLQRLQLHDKLIRDWGIEVPDEGVSNDAATKYTDFLLATASGKVEGGRVPGKIATPFEKTKLAAYTLAAVAPFMRLYAYISNEIQGILDPDDNSHIYRRWIDSFSSKDFEATALQNEEMLDKLSVSLTGEELEILEKLYHQAMKLEVDFIINSGLPIPQKDVVPLSRVHDFTDCHLTILCDFDLACTTFDSSAILAEIAIRTVPKAETYGSETQLVRLSSADLKSTWDILSTQYTEEFEKCVETIVTSKKVQGFHYEDLCSALEQLAEFERQANERVVQSGVLKGLNLDDIKRAGQALILQDGCRSFFQKIVKYENLKSDVHVLSYCWCSDLIVSAFSSGDLNALSVHSNELAYDESVTTGEIIKKLESPMEKLQAFTGILKGPCRSSEDEHKQLTVYIGGSVGDFLCLLQADIGIVIGSSSCLRRLGDHFGVSFVPLFSGLVKRQRQLAADEEGSSQWKPLSGTLYTVSSWAEIHAFILGT